MGASDQNGTVQFSNNNPLQFWRADGGMFDRFPFFNTAQAPAGIRTEQQTLDLGTLYRQFRVMQGNPHGTAHVRFDGPINNPATAPRDPLFFLLHCNVDRLWAKWQRLLGRFDFTQASAYDTSPTNGVGHRLPDTMWPWNGVITPPRPNVAPGGTLAPSLCTGAPGLQPRVQDCLDYQGAVNAAARMGFDYDDVRFV